MKWTKAMILNHLLKAIWNYHYPSLRLRHLLPKDVFLPLLLPQRFCEMGKTQKAHQEQLTSSDQSILRKCKGTSIKTPCGIAGLTCPGTAWHLWGNSLLSFLSIAEVRVSPACNLINMSERWCTEIGMKTREATRGAMSHESDSL
ncbi:hypothetical protein AOLI_G00146250 [Acnodon oligacanthus]